ncbi:MAG: DoxX family protein [bacterium]
MNNSNDSVLLSGRILLAAIFVMSGITKLTQFGGTVDQIASVGVPLATVAAVGAILVEVGGGLSVVFGYKARLGTWLLFLFLIPTTLLFHNPVTMEGQTIPFLKNLSIMGGLLVVAGAGAGRLALDSE